VSDQRGYRVHVDRCISATASENNANMNPFNPAKSFDITHKVYILMKEQTLYFGFMDLFS
jgi:hypothetical protein